MARHSAAARASQSGAGGQVRGRRPLRARERAWFAFQQTAQADACLCEGLCEGPNFPRSRRDLRENPKGSMNIREPGQYVAGAVAGRQQGPTASRAVAARQAPENTALVLSRAPSSTRADHTL